MIITHNNSSSNIPSYSTNTNTNTNTNTHTNKTIPIFPNASSSAANSTSNSNKVGHGNNGNNGNKYNKYNRHKSSIGSVGSISSVTSDITAITRTNTNTTTTDDISLSCKECLQIFITIRFCKTWLRDIFVSRGIYATVLLYAFDIVTDMNVMIFSFKEAIIEQHNGILTYAILALTIVLLYRISSSILYLCPGLGT